MKALTRAAALSLALTVSNAACSGADKAIMVPDTLDLAWHAEQAINALTGTLDEKNKYELFFVGSLVPPRQAHDAHSFCANGPKYLESLVMMRMMFACSGWRSR